MPMSDSTSARMASASLVFVRYESSIWRIARTYPPKEECRAASMGALSTAIIEEIREGLRRATVMAVLAPLGRGVSVWT